MVEVIGPVLSSSLSNCYKAAETIIERLALLKSNERNKDEITRKAQFLKSLIADLKSFIGKNNELTQSMIQKLESLAKQMEKCEEYCCKPPLETKIKAVDYVLDFLSANERKEALQNLEKGLSSAIEMISLMLHSENFMQERDGNRFRTAPDGCNPVYPNGKRPLEITNVQTKVEDKDHLRLTWDYNGCIDDVREFNVHITQGEKSLPTKAVKRDTFTVIFGRPIMVYGKQYIFRIQAISKSGYPGPLSDEMKVRFSTAPPVTPTTLHAKATGIDKMDITVTYPTSEEECNGSPATRCIVELFNTDDGNCTEWTRHIYKMHEGVYAPKELKIAINRLQEYCTYRIRARFYNDAGLSSPSEYITCKTLEPVPGPPTQFRFSSYRTANMIKLRWNRPDIYPRFVHHYEIEYHKSAVFGDQEWKPAGETHRLSFRVKDLPQDTRYYFRVRSVTENHQESVWTHEIDETTRFSKASKAALTPLVFVGATIGAPIIGAVGGTGVCVENEKKPGKAVAKGIAGGVGGTLGCTLIAPVVGGVVAHALIHEGDEYSDQSDED